MDKSQISHRSWHRSVTDLDTDQSQILAESLISNVLSICPSSLLWLHFGMIPAGKKIEQKGCCNKAVFRIGQEATSFKLFRYGITTYYYYYLLAQKTVKTVHRGKNYQRECVEWYIMMSLSGSLYVSWYLLWCSSRHRHLNLYTVGVWIVEALCHSNVCC